MIPAEKALHNQQEFVFSFQSGRTMRKPWAGIGLYRSEDVEIS